MSKFLQSNQARDLLRRFARNDRGNIAVLFSIALLPILGFVGAAVDYTRASNARTAMQSALDSAALMVSKDNAAGDLSTSQLTTRAEQYFNALYTNREAQNIAITAAYSFSTTTGQRITMTGAGSIMTQFMKIAGFPQLNFDTTTTTTWGTTKLRVAMALDNTGSMASSGKMSAMKTAAKRLIDQLSASAQNDGDVMISVVPFANVVNLGTSYKTSGYIDWSKWSTNGSIEEGWTCSTRNRSSSKEMLCGTANNNINSWNGCIMDRGGNTGPGLATGPDVTVAPPTTAANYYFADQSSYCPQPIKPLSYDFSMLKTSIDAMSPSGGTNQPIGLVWGWQTLKQTIPMNAPTEDPNFSYKKAIILLSDGLNTMDRWYGNGSSPSSQVDDRQRLLCDNVKSDGVTIYAIQVNTDGDPTSSVLANCASGSENFFMLTSATQVLAAFDTIGTSLRKLRISK